MNKLRALKEKLKIWNKLHFRNINTKLEEAKEKISSLDEISDFRELSNNEAVFLARAKDEIVSLERYQEIFWKQKS